MRHEPPVQDGVPCGSSGQALSQPPQWLTLFCGLMQVPAHFKNGLLHQKLQVPPLHMGTPLVGAVQALSQVPQWATSLLVSVQSPPQSVRLPGQPSAEHVPSKQTSPLSQGMLQPPQCRALELVLTQAPLHSLSPALQLMPHTPSTQVAEPPVGGVHTLSQLPQCSGSLENCRHSPLQRPYPALHSMSQVPVSQIALPLAGVEQAYSQALQFPGSLSRSLQ